MYRTKSFNKAMKTLIFDTETSGLPTSYNASFTDINAWPRVVEIAWLVLNETYQAESDSEFLVQPNGF